MGPLAQAAAAAAGAQRTELSRSLALRELGEVLPAAEASRLRVTVLNEANTDVSMGLFTLPMLDVAVQIPPKSEYLRIWYCKLRVEPDTHRRRTLSRSVTTFTCPYGQPLPASFAAYEAATKQPHQLLLFPQRLRLAWEFVSAVVGAVDGSGVLLSGPNGVGKSGVGFLAYLMCAARRLPVVYLSRTETWVQAAQRGEGDLFLLSAFWEQNADLIAASAPLRAVFAGVLRDESGTFTPQVMDALRRTARRHCLGIGLILDEVQHITAAVLRGDKSDSSTPAFAAGSYFRNNWHDWMNDNSVFARMSIASAHGERDFKLPSGEEHRLRIVEPLTDSQREVLQSHPDSPAYVNDAHARERIVFYSGNVLRALTEAARSLSSGGADLQRQLSRQLEQVHTGMQVDCDRWFVSLPEEERIVAAAQCKELLAGKMSWRTAKGLYDAGIMYRTADSDALRPVSAIASSSYLTAAARYILRAASSMPLSSITDGRQRGFALEARVLARLTTASTLVGTKSLDGNHADALILCVSYALPFEDLSEVVQRESPVLYQPLSLTYPCDGIIVGDAEGTIVVLECSTSVPTIEKRATKVLKYFRPDGVVSVLAKRFTQLPLTVALVFDGDLAKEGLSEDAARLAATGAATVCVLDRSSLIALGQIVL